MYKFQELACIKFTILLILIAPNTAFAYFDPGTGSLIVQGFIAALFGGLFWIKTKWKIIASTINKMHTVFKKIKNKKL